MSTQYIAVEYIKTPLGELILGEHAGKICLADWRNRKMRQQIDQRLQLGLNAEYRQQNTPLLQQTKIQIHAYFSGKCQRFDVPLQCIGTNFQQQVWSALLRIPFAHTISYAQLA